MSSASYLLQCLENLDIHICSISEHWLRAFNLHFLDTLSINYKAFAKPVPERDPFLYRCSIRGGVAILCRKDIVIIDEIETDCDRIVGLGMQLTNNETIYCFAVYLPASSKSIELFRECVDTLETLYEVYSEKGRVIVVGDVNVKIYGPRCTFVHDDRTLFFERFLSKFNIASVNVQDFCKGPTYTFNPVTEHRTMIDHILINAESIDQVIEARVLDDDVLNLSEHYPVYCSIYVSNICFEPCDIPSKLSWKKAKDRGDIQTYSDVLTGYLNDLIAPDEGSISNNTLEDYYTNIVSALNNAAITALPVSKFKKCLKPYWSDEINSLHNLMTNYRFVWISDGKPRGVSHKTYRDYKSAKSNFRNKLRSAFNKYISEELNDIDKSGEVNQKLFWTLLKNRGNRNRVNQREIEYKGIRYKTTDGIANAWALHFEDVFKEDVSDTYDNDFKVFIDKFMLNQNFNNTSKVKDPFLEVLFTVEEIRELCLTLKDGKAGGFDNLTYEHLKYGSETLFSHLTLLFNVIVNNEYLPKDWKRGVIVTIYKGNNKPKTDPNSYRGITLLPIIFKVFEMAISKRLSGILQSKTFPSRQQMAYQKGLSSLHTSFNLQECIHYNLEQGEQVHVAFLDSAKAFDTVWHSGLLYKMYDLGIKGTTWNLLRNVYKNMESCVYFNGTYSRWFSVERGIRQGSALSAKLYLVFINDLLRTIEKSKLGAMILDLNANAPTQADDICLISTAVKDLQRMLSISENYSKRWRFQFSALKSNILTFSKSKSNRLLKEVSLKLYGNVIPVVREITHVGILLNSDNLSIDRTNNACKKLKSATMSLIKSGVHPAALNPLTSSRLVVQIGYAKALYGSELWILSDTERIMLERANRYVAKSIQGFSNRTRSDMCLGTLGWITIEGFMDIKKLLYLGNICRLHCYLLPRRIFVTRLFMFLIDPVGNQRGFIPEIVRILDKYNLRQHVIDFVKTGVFLQKPLWKRIVNTTVRCYEESAWYQRMVDDDDFLRFRRIHKCLKPHTLWQLSIKHPEFKEQCHFVVKLCVTVRDLTTQELCHKCGFMYRDITLHIATVCSCTESERDKLWCFLVNEYNLDFSVYLHGLSDMDCLDILMGRELDYNLQQDDEDRFRIHAANESNDHYVFGSKDYLYVDRPKKFIRRKFLIIAIVVVVVCLIALGLGLGLGLQNKGRSNTGGSTSAVGGDGTGTSTSTSIPVSHGKSSTASQTSPSVVHQGSSTTQGPSTTSVPHGNSSSTTPETTTTFYGNWIDEPCMPPGGEPQKCPWSTYPLLVISLDGFRAEYLTRNVTPTIQRLTSCGVHTPYMRSVYPTLTFPNHYTIVTGLYPESHGIVYNNMYDGKINKTYTLAGDEKYKPVWWGGEPLWITAKKHGKKSASYFWVGSDVNISGIQPDIWEKYDGSIPYEDRVDTVISWLTLPADQRPEFILLYMDEPDHTGHGHGPTSKEVNSKLSDVDKVISRLMNGLYRQQLHNCVNLIILADHGMEATSCDRRVFLNTYMNISNYLILDGTIGRIYKDYYKDHNVVKKNLTDTPVENLVKSLECKSGQVHPASRYDLPVRHHFMNNDRIGDVVLDVEARYMVAKNKHTYCLTGNHGYDNLYKSMQALFLAHGPGFKQSYETKPFENIELYNLMAELLNITAAPNNGTLGSLHDILHKPVTNEQTKVSQYPTCNNTNTPATPVNDDCLCSNKTYIVSSVDNLDEFLPFGAPAPESEHHTCLLTHGTHVTGYHQVLLLPVWTSFTLSLTHKVLSNRTNPCLRVDRRVEYVGCDKYQNDNTSLVYTSLFRPEFGNLQYGLTSDLVPMYDGFKNGIWQYTLKIIQDYAMQTGSISVTMGTAFDFIPDGLWEEENDHTKYVESLKSVPIPTHYYVILIRCSNVTIATIQDCPSSQLDVLSLILPHKQRVPDCMPEEDYLLNNVARVKDIELLTGIRFLTKFSTSVSARLRTFLPTSLWKTQFMPLRWVDLPCDVPEMMNNTCPGKVPVLLISLDGFRANYLDRHLNPVIQKMKTCGVHSPYMRSVYPTVTFPNHYTIVTGLYPESHGIISNNMYDEEIGEVFSIGSKTKMDPRWWDGEPLWITAKKQNKKTATFFWPGSDVNISGIYPDIWKLYDGSIGFPERVSEVIQWLTLPDDQKPDFITLYFDQPDHAGHASGPDSENVNDQLHVVDGLIGQLMDALYHRDLHNCVNIILIADHGFDSVSCSQVVSLPNYMDVNNLLIWDGTFGRIQTEYIRHSKYSVSKNTASSTQSVESLVDKLMCKNAAMKVFSKETMPRRHHYFNNERIGEILLDMRTEWLVSDTKSFYCTGGNHGWDNLYKSMHALFVAHGPGFKNQIEIEPFENIELYNLMSELLDITPAPNNGTIGSLHHILSNPKPLPKSMLHDSNMTCTSDSDRKKSLQPFCSCSSVQNVSLDDLYPHSDTMILPFGKPLQLDDTSDNSSCIISYPKLVTLYDKDSYMPVWMTCTLSSTEVSNKTLTKDSMETNVCIMRDPGLDTATECTELQDDNITYRLLYHRDFVKPTGQQDIHFASSAVPMYDAFATGIWTFTWKLIQEYVWKYGNINIITGPIFDYDGDGLMDKMKKSVRSGNVTVTLPSHIYIIMVKCKNGGRLSSCHGDVDVQSFVLPHVPKEPNCLYPHDYLRDNMARVRDIELLTGLQFFADGQLTTADAARLRTYLSVTLWSADLLLKWIDRPCPSQPSTCSSSYRPLLLVSLDGFRADYLIRNFTPNVQKLSECGVHAPYMRSVYPTKTFPNHYTIATGLYPESHGIIDNNMFDPDVGEKFTMSAANASDPRWWGGEPIWNTVVRQNKTAGTYFWPGSGVKISGMRPTYYRKYDGKVPFDERVDTILSWIDNEQPDFLTLYFDEPDHAGHSYGPDDIVKIGQALSRVDEAIGRLMEGLYHRDMHNCVNIIIIADHGMADTSCDRLITFRDYLTRYNDMYIYEGAFSRINNRYRYARNGLAVVQNPESVSSIIANLTCKTPHFDVYRKSELPKRHHYANNKRIEDIIVDVQSDWLVTFRSLQGYNKRYCRGGNHGYDNIFKTMQALFLAHGPAFKQNLRIDSFENIELYNLMCDILNITAAPNNGTEGTLADTLLNPKPASTSQSQNYKELAATFDPALFTMVTNTTSCQHVCPFLTPQILSEMTRVLSDNSQNSLSQSKYVPFGTPLLQLPDKPNVNILHQSEFVTAFNAELQLPVWVSYLLNSSEITSSSNNMECILPDLRVNTTLDLVSSKKCQSSNALPNTSFEWASLVNRASQQSVIYGSLSSVFVPMLTSFKQGVWSDLDKLVLQWARKYKMINVISGPIFDYDVDGHADDGMILSRFNNGAAAKIPTHFFLIVTRCEDTVSLMSECQNVKTISFILPHTSDISNCQTLEKYLSENEARVRDIEWLTGLQFFTNVEQIKAVKIRTFLPSGLWN